MGRRSGFTSYNRKNPKKPSKKRRKRKKKKKGKKKKIVFYDSMRSLFSSRTGQVNRHHILPKVRRGTRSHDNMIYIDENRHTAFHFLFGVLTYTEAAEILLNGLLWIENHDYRSAYHLLFGHLTYAEAAELLLRTDRAIKARATRIKNERALQIANRDGRKKIKIKKRRRTAKRRLLLKTNYHLSRKVFRPHLIKPVTKDFIVVMLGGDNRPHFVYYR